MPVFSDPRYSGVGKLFLKYKESTYSSLHVKEDIMGKKNKHSGKKDSNPVAAIETDESIPFKITESGELDFKWFFRLSPEDQKKAMKSLRDAQDVEGMKQLEAALMQAVTFLYDKHQEQKGGKLADKKLDKRVRGVAKVVKAEQASRASQPVRTTDEDDDISSDADEAPVADNEGKKKKKMGCCTIL